METAYFVRAITGDNWIQVNNRVTTSFSCFRLRQTRVATFLQELISVTAFSDRLTMETVGTKRTMD